MVMKKDGRNQSSYVYGNVAYNIEPEVREQPVRRVRPNNKPVHKKSNNRAKIVGSIVIVSLMAFLTLCRFATIIKLTWQVRELKNNIVLVQKENENKRVDIAKLNNIRYIENMAVNKYKMIVPPSENVVNIDVNPLTASSEKQSAKGKIIGYNIFK